jgi:hypothetical protein
MQKIGTACKKMAQKLSCMDTQVIPPVPRVRASSGSRGAHSSSVRTPATSSAAHTPPHLSRGTSSRGKGPAIDEEDDDEEDDDEDDDEEDDDEEYQGAPGYGGHHQDEQDEDEGQEQWYQGASGYGGQHQEVPVGVQHQEGHDDEYRYQQDMWDQFVGRPSVQHDER